MTAKEYLSQAYLLDKTIAADKRKLEQLRELSTSLGSQDYTKDKVQSSIAGDKLSETVTSIVDLQNKINREIGKLVILESEIRDRINQIPNPDYRYILLMRYINREKWEQIALDLHYSYRHTTKLHGKALKNLKMP
jgi:hypothetical protein